MLSLVFVGEVFRSYIKGFLKKSVLHRMWFIEYLETHVVIVYLIISYGEEKIM